MNHTVTPGPYSYNRNTVSNEWRLIGADGYGAIGGIFNEANASHIVRCVNAFPELVAALEMCAATVELHTGNGAQSQPAWPRDKNGDIDYEAVASIARAALDKARA